MTTEITGTVTITRQFDAPIERAFDAWIDPMQAGNWLFNAPNGKMVRVEIDASVGGSFNFTDRRANADLEHVDVEHVGTYLEVDRPRRLVFTFAVPMYSKQFTRVSIDFRPLPAGCELTLTHEGILPEWIDRTRQGWGMIMDKLAACLRE